MNPSASVWLELSAITLGIGLGLAAMYYVNDTWLVKSTFQMGAAPNTVAEPDVK